MDNLMAIGRLDEDSEGLLLLTTDGKVSEIMRRKSVEKEYWVQLHGQVTEEAIERLQRGVEISLPSTEQHNNHGSSMMYTTLPCKACILETVIVEAKNIVTAKVQPTRQETKRKKKFKGACNKCGESGHKAHDCGLNPVDLLKTKDDQKTLRMALPPGIPPSKRSIMRDETRHGPTSWIALTINEGKNRQVRRMTARVGFPTLRLVRVRIGSIKLNGMAEGEVRGIDQSEIIQSI
eukprot:CAMPEP_0172323280 /NCGR_PEP_ID=MMETSP1058-20130122/48326_1 /TAXON_ID=83371 /ORGANISM="Detonula confervacea, Strain CCMP 353" /LENGTH=234 /DNA_ID=CAMNT_0013039241 /DNA_START=146 /DNA_END=850 /DNA_ORIENTATION=-